MAVYVFVCGSFIIVSGMGILLNDSFSNIPPTPAGFPECRNYPPPSWVARRPEAEDDSAEEQDETEGL